VEAQSQPESAGCMSPASSSAPSLARGHHLRARWLFGGFLVGIALVLGGYIWTARRPTTPMPPATRAHWHEALLAMRQHEHARARGELGICLTAWPLNAEANYLMARVCRELKDFRAWRLYLTRARQLQWLPDEVRLEERLQKAQVGNLASVQKFLMTYTRQRPDQTPLVYEALAEGYVAGRRYRELWELAVSWTALYPNDWLGWLYRGQAMHLGGNPKKALAEYQQALQRAPDPALVQLYQASAELGIGQHRQALETYQAALANEPDNPKALFGVALCQQALGNEAAAQAALSALLEHEPNHVPGLVLQGKLERSAGRLPHAIEVWRKAATLAPWRQDVLHNLAEALQANGEKAAAAKWRSKVEQVRAVLHEIAQLKKQLNDRPRDVAVRFRIAELERQLGNDEEAMAWYTGVLAVDPSHQASRRILADYARRAGIFGHVQHVPEER